MPLQVLELDVMDVCIVEERSYRSTIETSSASPDSYTAHTQRKHFLYFTDEKILAVLMEICRTLGLSTAHYEHEGLAVSKSSTLLFSLCIHNRTLYLSQV